MEGSSGILTGLIIGILLCVVAGLVFIDTSENPGDNVPVVLHGLVDGTHIVTSDGVVEKADLRLIAMPYIAASNTDTVCMSLGGTWHQTSDFVGCEGVGPSDCSTATAIAAQTQCIGANANWVCDANNVYCKY